MDQIREELVALFDGMLPMVGSFKKKRYDDIFAEGNKKYGKVTSHIISFCEDKSEDECQMILEELTAIIPDHAYEMLMKEPKKRRSTLEIDYNMNMAVYVIPILNYMRHPICERFAERVIEKWNEKPVTSLTLGKSSYDIIAGGFKKGFFCYITTAICDSMGKPDDCYELTTLRDYRDHYLMQTEEGKQLVEEYYETAPYLVQVLNMQKNSEALYEDIYSTFIRPCIQCIEQEKNEECKDIYVDMVRGLQKKYMN